MQKGNPPKEDVQECDKIVTGLQDLSIGSKIIELPRRDLGDSMGKCNVYQAAVEWDELRSDIIYAHDSHSGKVSSEIKEILAKQPEYPAWSGEKDALIRTLQHNAPPRKFFILGIPPSGYKEYPKISERQRCLAHFIVSEVLSKLSYKKNVSLNTDDQPVQIYIDSFVADPYDIQGDEKDCPLLEETQIDFKKFFKLYEPNPGESSPNYKLNIGRFNEFEREIAEKNSFVIMFKPENPFRRHIAKLCQDAGDYPGTIICTPSGINNHPSSFMETKFAGDPAGPNVEELLNKYEAKSLPLCDPQIKEEDKIFPEICIHSRKDFIDNMPPVKKPISQSATTKKT